MPQKRYCPEDIIARLREAEVLLSQGQKVPEVTKAIGIPISPSISSAD